MTAEEARKMSQNSEMPRLYNLIKEAAKEGGDNITVFQMTSEAIRELEKNGYVVRYVPAVFSYYRIVWK